MKIIIPALAVGLIALYVLYCCFPHRMVSSRRKSKILCIGDSITFGAGVIMTRFWDSWPSMLNRSLGKKWQVLNYGISGATAREGTDCQYRPSFRESVLKTDPEICIFMLGTNDSKPRYWDAAKYEEAVRNWISDLKSCPSHPRILLMLPPAAYSVGEKPIVYDIRNTVIRDDICPILHSVAEDENLECIDLYDAFWDHPEYFTDGVHPNKAGNQVIADLVYEKIK